MCVLFRCRVGASIDVTLLEIVKFSHFTTPRVGHDNLAGATKRTVRHGIDWLLQHCVDILAALTCCCRRKSSLMRRYTLIR